MSLWAAELDFCFSSVGQLKFLIGCHSLNRDAMIPNYKKSYTIWYTTSRTTCYPLWVGNNCWSYEEQNVDVWRPCTLMTEKLFCVCALLCTKIREEHHLEFLLHRDCVHMVFVFLSSFFEGWNCSHFIAQFCCSRLCSSWLFTVPLINSKSK